VEPQAPWQLPLSQQTILPPYSSLLETFTLGGITRLPKKLGCLLNSIYYKCMINLDPFYIYSCSVTNNGQCFSRQSASSLGSKSLFEKGHFISTTLSPWQSHDVTVSGIAARKFYVSKSKEMVLPRLQKAALRRGVSLNNY